MRLFPARVSDLLQVEHGAKGKSLAGMGGEGDQLHVPVAGRARNRAVGGAEVDTDGGDLILRLLHSFHYFALGAGTIIVGRAVA